MSYNGVNNKSAQGSYGESDPLLRAIGGAANLISEYVYFYYSSISKLGVNAAASALAKQTEPRKEEEINSNGDISNRLDIPPPLLLRDWMKITYIESNKRLKSQQFLQSLNDYTQGLMQSFQLPTWHINNSKNTQIDSLYSIILETRRYLSTLSVFQSSFHEMPYRVVDRWEDTRLLNYHYPTNHQASVNNNDDSTGRIKYSTPLLIVYAPINRYHIMDLNRGRSIVQKFVSAGFDVFLLDWGLQTNNKPAISDYVDYIGKAIETICSVTKSDKVNLLGYSWGGTLSAMYTAGSDGKKERIQNLIIQSSQIDFSKDNSILAEWLRSIPLQEFVEQFGLIDCHLINVAFIMRNPAVRIFDNIQYAITMGQPERFIENLQRIVTWLSIDVPYLPGLFFYQFVQYLYKENMLFQNKIQLLKDNNNNTQPRKPKKGREEEGEILKLSTISVPLLNIVGDQDDLTPAASSIPLNDVVSSKDKQLLRFPAGHVELCIGAEAHEKLWPQAVEWLEQRSERRIDF